VPHRNRILTHERGVPCWTMYPGSLLTPEQYLDIERAAEYKSEYCGGEMFAMARVGQAHVLVVMNVAGALWQRFRTRSCRVYSSNMRVAVRTTNLYTYPDVAAVCGEPRFLDKERDTLLNPVLLVEVLSPSTEAYDRGRKFEHYKNIDSLREYLLLSSDRAHADLYTKQADGRWLLFSTSRMEDTLTLDSVDAHLLMSGIYEKVELPPDPIGKGR
jgi:Uma2 family endonuclease